MRSRNDSILRVAIDTLFYMAYGRWNVCMWTT